MYSKKREKYKFSHIFYYFLKFEYINFKIFKILSNFFKKKFFKLEIHISQETFIFTNSIGNIGEPKTYQDIFNKLAKQANINNVHFHCLLPASYIYYPSIRRGNSCKNCK